MELLLPSHPGVGQLTPSNFMAVATATAALCCSIVPPFSRTLILFLFAIGQPEALEMKEYRKTLAQLARRGCLRKLNFNVSSVRRFASFE